MDIVEEPSVALVLFSYLSLDKGQQEKYLGSKIPVSGKVFKNPLSLLIQSLNIYFIYFFDEFNASRNNEQELLDKGNGIIASICQKKIKSRSDFFEHQEWEMLREFVRLVFVHTNAKPCKVPMPLPFEEWLEFGDLSRKAYDEYVVHMKTMGQTKEQIMPYE